MVACVQCICVADDFSANKKELVTDLIVKAKQVEYLINSLPEPEPEEEQVRRCFSPEKVTEYDLRQNVCKSSTMR